MHACFSVLSYQPPNQINGIQIFFFFFFKGYTIIHVISAIRCTTCRLCRPLKRVLDA